jgi:tetratricopeptide (TPR) repeat protein
MLSHPGGIMMPNARTLLVAGLAVRVCLGATAEMALPGGGNITTHAAPTTLGPHHAANPYPALSPAINRHGWTERLLEHAVITGAESQGRDHHGLNVSLNRLAIFYWTTGRQDVAELLLEHAIAVDERTHGCDHPGLTTSLDNLATLYQATGRHGAAEPLLERAIAIDVKAHGPENPNLAGRLNNLAVLYWATGRHGAAEPLFVRALAILRKRFPPEHPILAAIRENYVNLLVQLGRKRGDLRAADLGRGDLTASRGAAGLVPPSDRQA